jgi:diguanylate cyclase (GGDEF)-like protein/PAS domain S-box-containing protein
MTPEKPKILVVDDSRPNLVAMHKLLSRLDCEVVQADSGNEALACCISHDFALVLLDVDMPGMDGYEVARLLKDEPSTRHIPIIFVTATYQDREHQLRGYEAGAVDYIEKPVDDIILLSKANIFLDLYLSRRLAEGELARSEALRAATAEAEARFRQALTDAPIPIMLHAAGGEVLLLSQVWMETTGYTRRDIATVRDWLARAYGEDPDATEQHRGRDGPDAARDLWRAAGERKIRTADGHVLTWDFRTEPLAPLSDGRGLAITMAVDVTERKRAEEEMRLAALVFRNSSEGMMVTDADGRVVSVNPAFTELTGYAPAETIGKNCSILKSGQQDAAFYRTMWHELEATGQWEGEIWNRRKNGEIYAEWLRINTIFNADGSVHRRVALFSDITKRKESEELIWQQANFDLLTGLPNRRMFYDRLRQEIKKSHRGGQSVALMYLDLDHFKEVNDTLGHDTGDDLLKEAARRLSACVRESDTVARLGGDEFTVILGDLTDPGHVERIAQEILEKLSEPYLLGNELAHVSASIGITLFPDDASDIETLLKNADQAMYAAKNQGRRRYCYFTPSMQEAALARVQIANDLREALAKRQFRLYYQPIVEFATGAIHKAEALIRWRHPTRGFIGPAEFIPIAEETGTIVDIGDWVFREAVDQAVKWRQGLHPAFQISVNKSPVQFDSRHLNCTGWLDHLRQLGLSGDSIVVEITEGLLLDAGNAVIDKLSAFHEAGVHAAIDDFGTGYSALSYLHKFDIDYLKIDRSFVHNLTPGSRNAALCEAIVAMAHKLGVKVIAEGVETGEQRDFLTAIGCDYGQGFFYSGPLLPEDFERWMASR